MIGWVKGYFLCRGRLSDSSIAHFAQLCSCSYGIEESFLFTSFCLLSVLVKVQFLVDARPPPILSPFQSSLLLSNIWNNFLRKREDTANTDVGHM